MEHLGGPSSLLDEADLGPAVYNLINEIFNGVDSLEEVTVAMETRSHGKSFVNLIERFFGYYIYEQFCRDFYGQLVANIGDRRADESIGEIQDYIREVLRDSVSDRDVSQIDWGGSQGQQIVDDILQETLEVFSQ